MHPSLRLTVELPPVPVGGRTGSVSLEPWWQMALAALRGGAGAVWFTGGPTRDGSPDRATGCDACTIAAAAVGLVDTVLLGVVSAVPVDRHPAVLARDLTALDVVSGGRAAVLLRWSGTAGLAGVSDASPAGLAAPAGVFTGSGEPEVEPKVEPVEEPEVEPEVEPKVEPVDEPVDEPESGLSAACEHLGEAVAVCRSVLRDDTPVFEGRYLHVAGAVNRPRPRRPGGPPLLVEVPAGAVGLVGLAGREAGPAFLLRQVSSAAAAIACPDDPGEIASWRVLLEDAAASLWTGGVRVEVPAVVCRTTLFSGSVVREAGRPTERAHRSPTSAAVRSRLAAAHGAGAAGVVVRLPWGRRGDRVFHLDAGDSDRIADELAACFEPWHR